MFGRTQYQQNYYSNQPRNKGRIVVILGAITLLILIIIGFTLGGSKSESNSDSLETFSGAGVSIGYPKGYTKEVTDEGATFTEPGDRDGVRSKVVIARSEHQLDKDQYDSFLDQLKSTTIPEQEKDSGAIIEDIKLGDRRMIKVTRELKGAENNNGTSTELYAIGTYYVIRAQVITRTGDEYMTAKAQKILESLDVR